MGPIKYVFDLNREDNKLKKISNTTMKYDNVVAIRPKRREIDITEQFLSICGHTNGEEILERV